MINSTELHAITRRQLLQHSGLGLGAIALAQLFQADAQCATNKELQTFGGSLPTLHYPSKVKHVIYLCMSGGPSHLDLFDYKPDLQKHRGVDLPASIRMGQRITGMTSGQKSLPVAPSIFQFKQYGKHAGAWISELLPNIARIADDICIIRSMNTEAINHDPAITFLQTGSQQPGRPSLGAWLSYGVGSPNKNLPSFVVLISQGSGNKTDQPIFSRLWGSGFLPTQHQGVRLRSGKDPVLYLSNPEGIEADSRRSMLDATGALNRLAQQTYADPEINTRISQYEMAFRMQTSVPELVDLNREPKSVIEAYGIDEKNEDGGYARNCLLARRMVERGVPFVQLMHRGWDQHGGLPGQIRGQCKDVDKPSAALIEDLKRLGLFEETLVIWGGEFGRTVYSQGALTENNYGRDHHGRCFTMWMAGGGVKRGYVHGQTDDFGYNIVKDPVHIHDFNATILKTLGIDHTRLTFRFQGRDFRLTDVHGNIVQELLV